MATERTSANLTDFYLILYLSRRVYFLTYVINVNVCECLIKLKLNLIFYKCVCLFRCFGFVSMLKLILSCELFLGEGSSVEWGYEAPKHIPGTLDCWVHSNWAHPTHWNSQHLDRSQVSTSPRYRERTLNNNSRYTRITHILPKKVSGKSIKSTMRETIPWPCVYWQYQCDKTHQKCRQHKEIHLNIIQ